MRIRRQKNLFYFVRWTASLFSFENSIIFIFNWFLYLFQGCRNDFLQAHGSFHLIYSNFIGKWSYFRYLNPISNRGRQILPTISAVAPKFSLWLHTSLYGHRKVWKSGWGSSNEVGIICPLVEKGLTDLPKSGVTPGSDSPHMEISTTSRAVI